MRPAKCTWWPFVRLVSSRSLREPAEPRGRQPRPRRVRAPRLPCQRGRVLLGDAQARPQGRVPPVEPEAPAALRHRVRRTPQPAPARHRGADGRDGGRHGRPQAALPGSHRGAITNTSTCREKPARQAIELPPQVADTMLEHQELLLRAANLQYAVLTALGQWERLENPTGTTPPLPPISQEARTPCGSPSTPPRSLGSPSRPDH